MLQYFQNFLENMVSISEIKDRQHA